MTQEELEEIGSSKITRRFQITIPEEARKELRVEEGDFVVFLRDKKTRKISIRPAELVYKG